MDLLIVFAVVALGVVALAVGLFALGAVGFVLYYPLAAGWDGMKLYFHNRGWYDIGAE